MNPPFVIEVPAPRYFVDDHCANCLEQLPDEIAGLYCSTWCQEVAAHVRYIRGAQRDGRINDPDVQLAIRTKNAFLLIGGYRSLGRKLTPRVRDEVRRRDGGVCQSCGQPGIEVDHIAGSSDELESLQLLCVDCHHAKTEENMQPASDEERALLGAFVASRVVPVNPQLLADDDTAWKSQWRALQAARKERFLERLRAAGLPVRSKDTHLARVAALQSVSAPPEVADNAHDFGQDEFFEDVLRRSTS